MQNILTFFFSLVTAFVISTASHAHAVEPFGLSFGKTTLAEFKKSHVATPGGNNTWTKGPVYDMDPKTLGANGLTKAVAIFDTNERLVALILTFERNKFDQLNRLARERFELVKSELPHVGNKRVYYKDGDVTIELNSPHLSFDTILSYEHADFLSAYNEVMSRIRARRPETEGNLLFGDK